VNHTFSFLDWALLGAMIVTLAIVIGGLFVMVKGGDLNQRYGNKLMRWRITAQGISLGLFALLLLRGR